MVEEGESMRNAKVWLLAAVVMAALCGTALLTDPSSSGSVAAQERGGGEHWRWHDGHWSYWYPADNRWYYTDGTNWYYHDNDAWHVYRFDRQFGRQNFERGAYRVPAEAEKVVVPRHGIWRRK